MVPVTLTFVQNSKAVDTKLSQQKKLYETAKANHLAKPTAKQLRTKFVSAAVSYGTTCMFSPVLPARVKYRQALGLYREALAIDPKNKEALKNKKTIEDIYRQMGRPIPKE